MGSPTHVCMHGLFLPLLLRHHAGQHLACSRCSCECSAAFCCSGHVLVGATPPSTAPCMPKP